MTKEICGAETNAGGECKNPAESCPWHDEDGNRTDVETGRKGKYNEETVEKIIEAAKEGLPLKGCARAGGIDQSTLYEWLNDDRKQEFSSRLKSARAKAEKKLAKEARKKDPRYLLTRSFKWDKPSADTEVNVQNQMAQKQNVGLKLNLNKTVVDKDKQQEESEQSKQ